MKLIQGMKETKLIVKKIQQHTENLPKYSSLARNQFPIVGDKLDDQRKYVDGMTKSCGDLFHRLLRMRRDIAYTNVMTFVKFRDAEYSITELIAMRVNAHLMGSVYKALNTNTGFEDVRNKFNQNLSVADAAQLDNQIIRMYDEPYKDEAVLHWATAEDEINMLLEVVNATTELLSAPTAQEVAEAAVDNATDVDQTAQ